MPHPSRRVAGDPQPLLSPQAIGRTRARLLRWGRRNYRSYPWRSVEDPWLSFLAEFLLQRTQAIQVAGVFSEVCKLYPTAEALASSGHEGVRYLTDKLGLHWRGPLLLEIAKTVAATGGSPPDNANALRSLKGVGAYTAGAWLSLHRRRRATIIDSNIARWLARMSAERLRADIRHDRRLARTCEVLTPARSFKDYNYAVLDFTMTVCVRGRPHCDVCLVKSDCATWLSRADGTEKSGCARRRNRKTARWATKGKAASIAEASARRTGKLRQPVCAGNDAQRCYRHAVPARISDCRLASNTEPPKARTSAKPSGAASSQLRGWSTL